MTPKGVLPIVIGDPRRGLGPALSDGWLARAGTLRLPSVEMRRGTLMWDKRVDETRFRARFGRVPLESEIGCAAAHVSAYEALLQSTSLWALVLEDDAIVTDHESLSQLVAEIVDEIMPTGHVVSLYSEGPLFASSSAVLGMLSLLRLRLPPQGAVAYLVDRIAAELLVAAQSPIASVSDWPLSVREVEFEFAQSSVIHHETRPSTSTVAFDIDRSTLVPTSVRIQMWTGLWYLKNHRQFEGFGDYLKWVLGPRLVRKLAPPLRMRNKHLWELSQ